MRVIATLLLGLMTLVFIATNLLRRDWAFLPYLRAFSEAGMVGACADWFAVVALFRHPFGIPIPHTAVIPSNQQRIGAAAGRFIANNFLTARVLNQKLLAIDSVGWLANWISDSANAKRTSLYTAGALPKILSAVPRERLGEFLGMAARHGVEAIPATALASKALSILWAQGEALGLIEQAIKFGELFLTRHRDFIIQQVSQRSSRWIPKWVDTMIADRIVKGLIDSFAEMRDPGHPWRIELERTVEKLIDDLATDPKMRASGEAMKAELLNSPLFLGQVETFWVEIEHGLYAELPAKVLMLAGALETGMRACGAWLQEDSNLHRRLNRWIRLAALRILAPRRADIGNYVSDVIQNWDTTTLVNRVELQVGKDLQYIRINGTLVGGVVGLLLFIASKWMNNP